MSDNILRIIPDAPDFIPDFNSMDQAVLFLGTVIDNGDEIESKVNENIIFVDPGSNLESVSCPSCSSDITDWWSKEMDNLYKNHFSTLEITTPCCQNSLSMNDLDYNFQAGFARFVIEIRNPSIGGLLDDTIVKQVESLLGCKVRQIMAHY